MAPQHVTVKTDRRSSTYEITIGHGLLGGAGEWARLCLGGDTRRLFLVSNPTVFRLYGTETVGKLEDAGFFVSVFLMKDGERHKSLRTAGSVLKAMAEARVTRTDGVVALGGGVVGDLAGFAAALHLRGISFLQVPTSLLSMIDSSVGGKTGVNSPFGKNLIGAFHQPAGVLIDPFILRTLPRREIVAGLCEMVKHATLDGPKLLEDMAGFLSKVSPDDFPAALANLDFISETSNLILRNIEFKAKIVAQDELESSARRDSRSRKILNFGHTLAHALEKVSDYRYFKHGEAVGYGILFAAELSKKLELCSEKDVKLLNDVVQSVGNLPPLTNIDHDKVLEAFAFDKKNMAGSLQFVLIKGIGKPVVVSEKDIPRGAVKRVLKQFLQKWS